MESKSGIIKISKKKAEIEWKNYREVLKTRNDKYLQELYECFSQMRRGRKLIDIIELMKEVGLNDKEEPKMAIANCNWKEVEFEKEINGSGSFVPTFRGDWTLHIKLPAKTFKEWTRLTKEEYDKLSWSQQSWIKNAHIKTKVPIIPAQFLPRGKLNNYYILWEVEDWENIPPKKDPILLKRLSNNLFAVLAVWKLTKLEQSIIRGR